VRQKPNFIIPEWADWVLAFAAAGGIWLWMNSISQPTTSVSITLVALVLKVVIVVVVYFLVWVIIRSLAEPSRLYGQGLKILNQEVKPRLDIVTKQLEALRILQGDGIANDVQTLNEALRLTQDDIIGQLREQNGIPFFNGMIELRPKVDALAKLVPGHVLMLQKPSLVENFADKVAENRQGLRGYLEFCQDMAKRVSSGEIFSMTTGARMLSALVNVLPKGSTQ